MSATRRELEGVEEEIRRVQEEVERAQWELKVRERQFRVVMASIGDLKCVLGEEEIVGRMNAREKDQGEDGGGGSGGSGARFGGNTDSQGEGREKASSSNDVGSMKKRKRVEDGSDCNDDVGAL